MAKPGTSKQLVSLNSVARHQCCMDCYFSSFVSQPNTNYLVLNDICICRISNTYIYIYIYIYIYKYI